MDWIFNSLLTGIIIAVSVGFFKFFILDTITEHLEEQTRLLEIISDDLSSISSDIRSMETNISSLESNISVIQTDENEY